MLPITRNKTGADDFRVTVTRGLGLVAIAFTFAVGAPAPVHAQFAVCGERTQIVDQLKAKYKEQRQAVGLIANSGAAELYVSEAGTWTMLVTLENGKSCIIAAGHSWDSSPTLAQGTGI
jgi:hypothetical protein